MSRPPVRDQIALMDGYHSPQVDVRVRLNTNEAPEPPPAAFVDALAAGLSGIAWHRYPDRAAVALRSRIAEVEGAETPVPIDATNVFAANGSNEVLQSICLAYGGAGRTVATFEPTYALHSHIARVCGSDVVSAAREADFFAFTVLDSLLTGPTSLNMFGGGGISNKTSRLYRALVERELAVGVGGSLQATHDPFTYDITITVHPNQTPELVLQAVDVEIQKLQQAPVKADEITRAIKQARALFAYGSENITNQAFWLGYAEMFDHYDWFLNYMERLEQITPADVQRVAQTCLLPTRRVVGIYRPTGTEEPE